MDRMQLGIDDIVDGLKMSKVAFHFAWTETLVRYRRSVLGPFWMVLGTAIGVVGLGYVWSNLFNIEKHEFLPTLTVGLILWQLISSSLMESSSLFIRNTQTFINIRTPSFFISLQQFFKAIINFAHSATIVLLIMLIYPEMLNPYTWLSLVGLLLLFLNLLWIIHLIGYIGARYRDTEPLLSTIMPIIFFLSPVMYKTQQLDDVQFIMLFNPVAHLIDVVRAPLLGSVPSAYQYLIVIGLLMVGSALALSITHHKRRWLPYWL